MYPSLHLIPLHSSLPIHHVTLLAALRVEELAGLVECRLAALEASPGVGVRVRRVDGADEVAREAVALLEGVERLEGARQDHAAEVEEGRSNGHSGIVGCGLARTARRETVEA